MKRTDKALGETGQIFVTASAARTFAHHTSLLPEEARRRLTSLLLSAKQTNRPIAGEPERWRFRRQSTGLDINAHVSREDDGLAVIVYVHVRNY